MHRLRSHLPAALVSVLCAAVSSPAWAEPAQGPAAPQPNVTPPQVLEHVDPAYPRSMLARAVDTTVVVAVVVERDGSVSDATIAESGGAEFDEVALAAVKQWRFAPAMRGGTAVRARIRVPFHFAPGPHTPAPESPHK